MSEKSSSKPVMPHSSAIPDLYYFWFAVYEPLIIIIGVLGTLADPKSAHDAQAPWPNNQPPDDFPLASRVTILQLGHVCALLGIINYFVLTAARTHLSTQPALQEKVVSSFLTPLLVGDFAHLFVTLLALGDQKWDLYKWPPMVWAVLIIGLSLMVPRIAWHLGVGRYVDKRDGNYKKVADNTKAKVINK